VILRIVARRYAKALIELGSEQGNLESLVKEFGAVAEAIESSPELRAVLDNPQVARPARKAVLGEIAQRLGAGSVTRNTLGLLSDNGRLRAIPEIARALREESDVRAGVLRATVTSATPLNDAYVQKLTQALEARFKKKVLVQREVDPKLLSGVVTRVGDTIIDGSLRTRLDELRSALLPH
jgi:F-type H+-transporting ATPase subunit delta